jgi:hypothetical protein
MSQITSFVGPLGPSPEIKKSPKNKKTHQITKSHEIAKKSENTEKHVVDRKHSESPFAPLSSNLLEEISVMTDHGVTESA